MWVSLIFPPPPAPYLATVIGPTLTWVGLFESRLTISLGLKVNRGNNFSCVKVLSIAYVLCTLRLLMLKTEGKKYKQNSLLKSYKIAIKILANPGLA